MPCHTIGPIRKCRTIFDLALVATSLQSTALPAHLQRCQVPHRAVKIQVVLAESACKVCQTTGKSCTERTRLEQCGSCLNALHKEGSASVSTEILQHCLFCPDCLVSPSQQGALLEVCHTATGILSQKLQLLAVLYTQKMTQLRPVNTVHPACSFWQYTCQEHDTTSEISSKLIIAGFSSSRARRCNLQNFDRQSRQTAPGMSCKDQG